MKPLESAGEFLVRVFGQYAHYHGPTVIQEILARDRRIRLEETEYWLACLRTGSNGEKSGYMATTAGPKRLAELRAPVPAERADAEGQK